MQAQGLQRGASSWTEGAATAEEEGASDAGASPRGPSIGAWRGHRHWAVRRAAAQAMPLHQKVRPWAFELNQTLVSQIEYNLKNPSSNARP